MRGLFSIIFLTHLVITQGDNSDKTRKLDQMTIKIENSRNITNVSAINPKVRLQMATNVCVSNFTLIKCGLKLKAQEILYRISGICPEVRLKMATKSVDGCGNFKIRKFFEVKTGKCSKFIFLTLFSLCERPKSIPFFI